ncbi:MAG: hypothetical protein Kow0065_10130 [Methylomicrobium sp.]
MNPQMIARLLLGSMLIANSMSFAFAANAPTLDVAAAGVSATAMSENIDAFIRSMSKKHRFDPTELARLFQSVEIQPRIIEAMTRPAEAMPWYKYRKIFMTDARIESGVRFMQNNADALAAAERKYGVPPEIIVAIIGVETSYGANTGSYRVIDALSTLAFNYPKRSAFFTSELENFLLLCREEKLDPLKPTGSYAGAMGIPQFMPSSYRAYAADFEGDLKRDIWHNPADAIASVANYFFKHHWQRGKAIAIPVSAEGAAYRKTLGGEPKPDRTVAQWQALGIRSQQGFDKNLKAKLLAFEQEEGQELWLGFDNFYVITRYNHSPLYAMAVYQLSRAIAGHPVTQTNPAVQPVAMSNTDRSHSANQSRRIYLQLGAFGQEANARALHGKVVDLHVTEPSITVDEHSEPVLYKVRLGPFQSTEEADAMSAKLTDAGIGPILPVIEETQN